MYIFHVYHHYTIKIVNQSIHLQLYMILLTLSLGLFFEDRLHSLFQSFA